MLTARKEEARTMPTAATMVRVAKTGTLMRDGSTMVMVRSLGGSLLSDIHEMADTLIEKLRLSLSYSPIDCSWAPTICLTMSRPLRSLFSVNLIGPCVHRSKVQVSNLT